MRHSTIASDLDPNDIHIEAGKHSQIWIGKLVDICLMFDNDQELAGWVSALYAKMNAAIEPEPEPET